MKLPKERKDRVLEASRLNAPPCLVCRAWPGDPCRDWRGRTTEMHAARRKEIEVRRKAQREGAGR